jgi:prepilin-type N-terminal cleavage/methylation domain-containing protein
MMRHRNGFTLLELLIVVLVLGVLAMIAIPRFAFAARTRALDAAAKSDLRNAMHAQEAYFAGSQTYAADLGVLGLTPSTGVVLAGGGTSGGYKMTAYHAGSGKKFTIEVGPEGSPRAIN